MLGLSPITWYCDACLDGDGDDFAIIFFRQRPSVIWYPQDSPSSFLNPDLGEPFD